MPTSEQGQNLHLRYFRYHMMYRSCNYDYSSSVDSQFAEQDEISFLEACAECDEDALYDIIQDGVTYEQVNERDRNGRVSHFDLKYFMKTASIGT